MSDRRRWLMSLVLLLPFLLPGTARGAQWQAHCDEGENNLQVAIDSITNRATEAHTITVFGTCKPTATFGFVANGFLNLTIVGDGLANLHRDSLTCDPSALIPAFAPVLQILNSGRVVLRNLSISGGSGLFIQDSAVVSAANGSDLSDVTVNGSSNHGIDLGGFTGSRGASLTLTASDVVANNCRSGVSVPPASTLLSQAEIHHNGTWGVNGAGFIAITGGSIHDNGIGGVGVNGPGKAVLVALANITISSNGSNASPADAAFSAGVSGTWGGIVQVVGNVTISNNAVPGILLRLNSTGAFGGMSVLANAGGGVKLQYASAAEFTSAGGVAVLQGNGAVTGDLNCDDTSNAFGDVSGAVQNNCQKDKALKAK